MSALVPVAEQLSRVLSAVTPLPVESVPLADAAGRWLAEDVVARAAVPPWDNAAMDGYAVRHRDVADASPSSPVTLQVVADLPAGTAADPALGSGQAARIMTGAPVPLAADTVVRLEDTDRDDPFAPLAATVTVRCRTTLGRNVRRAGEDLPVGGLVAAAGTHARPAVLAALAAAGHGVVPVRRAPRVAVIATGSELVDPGTGLTRGRIPDSNSLLVSGLVSGAGGRVVATDRVPDDPQALARALVAVGGCDVVVLTGGVSAGAFDPVKQLFAGSNQVAFTRVAMQPGKPQAFGRLPGGGLLFGLPGNPVSVWVSFHVFVRPALLAMQGAADDAVHPAPVAARAGAGWESPEGRTQYLPARLAADPRGWVVRPVGPLGSASHLVASLAAATGYAVVPAYRTVVAPGDLVDAVVTDPCWGEGVPWTS